MMKKQTLWLLLAERGNRKVPAVVGTLGWFAEREGVKLEMYLESERDGRLFAQTGSTVLGGRHFQQFNYLFATFEVKCILLGKHELFESSLKLWDVPVLAEAESATALYQILGIEGERVVLADGEPGEGMADLRPYLYQEVFFRKALGIPAEEAGEGEEAMGMQGEADYREFTVALAEKWTGKARGVAFGDPDAILAMLATLCREHRVAVFGKRIALDAGEIVANGYAEEHSSASGDVCRLCERLDNRVIVGRQTCDGDLFEWSRSGVAIQIMDPNRPAFGVVGEVRHRWATRERTVFDMEADDETLERWADEGKTLASLLVHSGEMAHNEAMLNLVELCCMTGLKLGIGVHAARYQTCPQLWELIATERARGGALGLIEPVLHAGGMGVVAENVCEVERLARHCRMAMNCIEDICGKGGRPRGYLAFMDTDMSTFTRIKPEMYAMLGREGMTYCVSSAQPGRNRILYQDERIVALNQGSRSICTGSPYVRVTSMDDLVEKSPGPWPGWWLGVIDAPVVSFNAYIWRRGERFMEMVDALTKGPWVNVTPGVVGRYAKILAGRGRVPGGVS